MSGGGLGAAQTRPTATSNNGFLADASGAINAVQGAFTPPHATLAMNTGNSFLDAIGNFANDVTGFSDVVADWNRAFSGNDNPLKEFGTFGMNALASLGSNLGYTGPARLLQSAGQAVQNGIGVGLRAWTAPVALSHPEWGQQLGMTPQQYHDAVMGSIWNTQSPVSAGQIWAADASSRGPQDPVEWLLFRNLDGQNINPYNPTQRANYFTNAGAPAKWTSGALDATVSTLADPTNFAGPAFKATKAATLGEMAIQDAAPQALIRAPAITTSKFFNELTADHNRWSGFLDELANEPSAARILEGVKSGRFGGITDPEAFSHLMAPANDRPSVIDTLTVMGNFPPEVKQGAIDRLLAKNPTNGELPYLYDRLQNGNTEAWIAATYGTDHITDPGVVAKQAAMIKQYISAPNTAFDTAYQDALKSAVEKYPAGILRSTPRSNLGRGIVSMVKPSDATYGEYAQPRVTTIQPTDLHPRMSIVDYFTQERPSGWMSWDDGDKSQEFLARLQHADKYTGGAYRKSGAMEAWMNTFLAAQNPHDWQAVVNAQDLHAATMVAAKHGYTAQEALTLWQNARGRMDSAIQQMKDQGFASLIDDNGKPYTMSSPFLERQTASQMHLAFPLDYFDKVLRDADPESLKTAIHNAANFENPSSMANAESSTMNKLDTINNALKINMLLRGGYMPRNLGEAYLSMAASGYLGSVVMTAAKESPQIAANWVANKPLWWGQKVDRTAIRLGGRESYASLQARTSEALAELRVARAQQDLHTMLLRGYDMHTADLSPTSLRQLAQIRGEADQEITYHVTDAGLPEIKGDWLATTDNRGVANTRKNDLYQYHSTDSLGEQIPAGATPADKTGILLNHARYLLQNGQALDYLTSTGWAPMTEKFVDSYIARHTKDGVFKPPAGADETLIRARAAGKKPDVVSVRSYGKTLDATDARKLPVGVDPTDLPALANYARSEGYGRVVVKDPEWGRTTLVLRDTADYKGGMGAKPIIQKNADDLLRQYEMGAQSIEAMPVRSHAEVAAMNRHYNRLAMGVGRTKSARIVEDVRNRVSRKSGQPVRPAVIPQYTSDEIQAHLNANIVQALRDSAERVAKARAKYDIIQQQFEQRASKVENVYRAKRRSFTGPGEAFDMNDPQGLVMMNRSSADTTQAALIGSGHADIHIGLGGATVNPDDPRYFETWRNFLNHYVRGEDGRVDPVYQRMLDGQSNQQIADWIASDPVGKQWADNVGAHGDGINTRLAEGRAIFEQLVRPELRQQILDGHMFTEHDLRRLYGESPDLAQIKGRLVPGSPEQRSNLMGEALHARTTAYFFRMLGSLPETTLARHPLFNVAFEREQKRVLGELKARLGPDATVGVDDLNKIKSSSREYARQVVNRTLFTIERRTDAAKQLRFMAPFYAAWENSLRRWAGFVVHTPQNVLRLDSKITQGLNDLTIVDQNGDIIPLSKALSDWNQFQNANFLLPWSDSRYPQSQVQIPLQSLDVAFGGQPGPGLGPIAEWPLAWVVKEQPSTSQMLTWAFPSGVPNDPNSVFLSAWQKRIESFVSKDQSWLNTVNTAYKQRMIEWRASGGTGPQPSVQDATKDAQKLYMLHILANLMSPVSLQFGSDVNYYTNALRTLEDKYSASPNGYEQAETEFLQKYPEAVDVLPSNSKSTFGVLPSVSAVDQARKYSNLANVADAINDPSLFGFVANYGLSYTKNDYSQAAYQWELANSPEGTNTAYRGHENVDAIDRDAMVSKGWIDYRRVMDQTESQMKSDGIDPASKDGASILSKVRSAFAFDQQAKNPQWYQDYRSADPAKFDKREEFFKAVMQDPTFMADHGTDPVFQYIKQFFVARDWIAGQLRDRKMAGGSSNLSANSNQDLALNYLRLQTAYRDSNIQFAAWMDRYFTNDPVSY